MTNNRRLFLDTECKEMGKCGSNWGGKEVKQAELGQIQNEGRIAAALKVMGYLHQRWEGGN